MALIEYGLRNNLIIIRDTEGAVIESLAGLLAAVAVGEWPG